LAYVPKFSEEEIPAVSKLFEFLELSFGGSGNGVGYFDAESKPIVRKAVKQTHAESAVELHGTGGIFHSRMASMGSVCDKNCHPFQYNGVITCHNGHWSDSRDMAKLLKHAGKFSDEKFDDMTDSEVIACLVGNYGFAAADIVDSGVILSLYPDHAMVYVKGDFEVVGLKDGRFFYASEFPREFISMVDSVLYKKFSHGSVAKLSQDGMRMLKGELTDTVPTAWPTYKRGTTIYYGYGAYSGGGTRYYGGDELWDDGYFLHPITSTQTMASELRRKAAMSDFCPTIETGKRITVDDVTTKVFAFLRIQESDITALSGNYESMDFVGAVEDLENALVPILQDQERAIHLKYDVNQTVRKWLEIYETIIIGFKGLQRSLMGETPSSAGNGHHEWVEVDGEWIDLSSLSRKQRRQARRLASNGSRDWD
jgi:hypothetical protein